MNALASRLLTLKALAVAMVRDSVPATKSAQTFFVPKYQMDALAALIGDIDEAAAALSGREAVDRSAESLAQELAGRFPMHVIVRALDKAAPGFAGSYLKPKDATPQGDGVVEANALSADELVELDKLVADVGPQQALNIFVELRAAIAGKVDEADRSIAELKRRAAAPSAKGVANG